MEPWKRKKDPQRIVRERAIKMVLEHEANYESRRAAINSIAGKFGCHPKTLMLWVHQAERNQRLRPGPTTGKGAH